MADGLPPPPSYTSLFAGDSSQHPSAPPPPTAPQQPPDASYPPSYPPPGGAPGYGPPPPQAPYAPPPQGGPYPAAPPGAAPAGYPSGPFGGYIPPAGVPGPVQPGDYNPEKPPIPPASGGAEAAGGAAPYPSGPFGNYIPPGGTAPPHPQDPLLNPAYPPGGPTNYNTGGQYPTTGQYPAPGQYHPPGQFPPPTGQYDGAPIPSEAIPILIVDDPPINRNAPPGCVLASLEDYPDFQIAPGQRERIDQLEDHEKPAHFKHCCVAFWSIGAHVSFVVCVLLLIWQVPLKQEFDQWWSQASRIERISDGDKFEYNKTTLICASVFLCVCYLIAVIEGCASDTDSYVQTVQQLSEFKTEHDKRRAEVPTVVLTGEAYHTAKERITWKDGRIVSRRRSSDNHRCVTYMEKIAFPFRTCIDASGPFDNFKKGVINRIEFEKTFGFLDSATAAEYNFQKQAMENRVKDKDDSYDMEEELIIPEYKDRSTVYMEEGCRTSLMSSGFYTCLTCLLCTWPYRVFFRLSTTKKKYTYVKLIGIY